MSEDLKDQVKADLAECLAYAIDVNGLSEIEALLKTKNDTIQELVEALERAKLKVEHVSRIQNTEELIAEIEGFQNFVDNILAKAKGEKE